MSSRLMVFVQTSDIKKQKGANLNFPVLEMIVKTVFWIILKCVAMDTTVPKMFGSRIILY